MQQIFNFVIRNKTFLLFLLLFGIALSLTIQSHSYHRSKFINSANSITGGVYGAFSGIDQYFSLKSQNALLLEENNKLRSQIFNYSNETDSILIDSSFSKQKFRSIPAKVYSNSYSRPKNYLTLNKGKRDSIKQDFGVITSKGIVGIIDNTSNGYSTVLSILNENSAINAQLKSSNQIGSLRWNTISPYIVQLEDISKFANIAIGDTIITGGQSSIFPKGIGIGTIASFEENTNGDTYNIEVKLFNDMTNIGHVFIIENLDIEEIKTLEQNNDE
ncbi:rod shape-determining protein MreC [Winogradskyella immobilis]|uniref:Cell shape-determining protein MreC n=1 Tax=Winogradskyella immobilis TaxID=2816852 RepID=A0ABS8EL91_9FLAO|nr:rod shape-determining protein MreC [Winogradskyella immobilis]MCC1483985.1 rod shape-determining protein MreC [Winogradskyella immobilis]MCG0016077.1 rod shape-determining protein MreC [Winogradskyella immobilis]